MPASYEYRVVPAPTRGLKGKGIRGTEDRFAHAIEDLMNRMALDGWEYQRAETLPSEERQGLTGVTTTYRNVLVFRRARAADPAPFQPRLLAAPEDAVSRKPAQAEPPATPPEDETPQDGATVDPGLADALRRRAATLLGGRIAGGTAAEAAPATDGRTAAER
ncbi:DUF4177 domain-containing protein [Oceanicola sp. 22II-s10i]|uniref:DUF4177 domain-containing protein n=1 Tax=Oceanicola sp. 22II-s10i TaxID=1317116 RepID=UPI000B51F525|nr:DUF4177 domain-containing protein [Oceanicola sp. 22II-s10i]